MWLMSAKCQKRTFAGYYRDTMLIYINAACSPEEFDLAKLDRTIALLDHYKAVSVSLAPATAF